MHCFIKVGKHQNKTNLSSGTHRKVTKKVEHRAKRHSSLFSCNSVMSLYKSETHVAHYCNFKLSTDTGKKSGPTPMYVSPSKTVAAPYGQGNELVFGQKGGQQCVAMSLCFFDL